MKSNFSSEALLCGLPITLIDKRGGIYQMRLPVLRDKIENMDYDIFIGFCATSIKEFNVTAGANFKDKFQLFKFYKKNKVDVLDTLNKYFEKYMIGFKYVDDSLYWGERLVGKEIFETFCMYVSVAAGVMPIKELDYVITEDMDEFEKRRIMLEQKIQQTKAKGQESGKGTKLDVILTGVAQEFGYHYCELLNMTLYSIYYMYSHLGAIMNYEVGNIAAGNGLLNKKTKHNHWAH